MRFIALERVMSWHGGAPFGEFGHVHTFGTELHQVILGSNYFFEENFDCHNLE